MHIGTYSTIENDQKNTKHIYVKEPPIAWLNQMTVIAFDPYPGDFERKTDEPTVGMFDAIP